MAELLPTSADSALEEFFRLRLQLVINVYVLDDDALSTWLGQAAARAASNFARLLKFETTSALEVIFAMSAIAEATSAEAAASVGRTRDGALSICKDHRLLNDKLLQVAAISGAGIAEVVLGGRRTALKDGVSTRVMRGITCIAQDRFDEAIEAIAPLVADGSGPDFLPLALARAHAAAGAPNSGIQVLRETASRLDDGAGWVTLGEFCLLLGEEAKAEEAYSMALLAGAEDARLPHARVLARLGRANEARLEFEVCAARDETAQVRLEFASFLSHSGDLSAAESVLRGIVDVAPALAIARLQLARSLSKQGRHKDALEVVEAGLAAEPHDGELLREAANLVLPEAPKRALAYLERLVDCTATSGAMTALGDLLFHQGRFKDASRQYASALDSEGVDKGELRHRLALSLERAGAVAEAEAELRRNVAYDGSIGQRRKELAWFLYRQRRYDAARAELLRACEVGPDDTEAIAHYCRWLAESGEEEESLARLHSGLQRWIDDANLMDALSDISFAHGDRETALTIRRRIAEGTNTASAWLKLGDAYIEAGDGKRGRETFELAISRYPEDGDARSKYARALWASGDAKEAERQYLSNTTLRGDLAGPWIDLAHFLSALGRSAEAHAALDKARQLEPANFDVYLALPVILAPSGDHAALADDLIEGSRTVQDLGEVLEAAAHYYRSGDAKALVEVKDRIGNERGAQFLNQIAWAACVDGRVDEAIRIVAVRALELSPSAEIAHTLALTEFLVGAVDEALRTFERFATLVERHQIERAEDDVALLVSAAQRAGAGERLLEILRETRKAGWWREWADALSACLLDADPEKLVPSVAHRLALLRKAHERRAARRMSLSGVPPKNLTDPLLDAHQVGSELRARLPFDGATGGQP